MGKIRIGLCIRARGLTVANNTRPFTCPLRPAEAQRSISHPQKICARHLASAATRSKKPRAIKMVSADEFILTLSCPDRPGIVHAVTGFLAQHNLNIVDSQQFGDPTSKTFFMRVHFAQVDTADGNGKINVEELRNSFEETAKPMSMKFDLSSTAQKPRVLIMVSKIGHHLPITAETKADQESKILELVKEHNIDLIVLARYMQVLSPALCSAMSGKIINIHHSFLPSFKGAKPYHQAYDRGVKIIGATAHFVTSDLDEGPIIEQDVVRVDHGLSPKGLTTEGSNVESKVLANAVKWVTEKRVLLNGSKTVVFN